MARILYSLAGEGRGHSMTAEILIKRLKAEGHDLLITTYGVSYKYLEERFEVEKIGGINFVYNEDSLDKMKTVSNTFIRLPLIGLENFFKFMSILLSFRPEIVICDFEPYSSFYARLFRIPMIHIDNQNMFVVTSFDMPRRYLAKFLQLKTLFKGYIRKGNQYLVQSFYKPRSTKKNVDIVPVLLRERTLRAKPRYGKHIFVYQTSDCNHKLMRLLNKFDERFIVYGFDQCRTEKNIEYREFNEDRFFDDFAHAKAVITNGGLRTTYEALYLRKPVLVIPIKLQHEQFFNGYFVKKLGYGTFFEDPNYSKIKDFLKKIPLYRRRLKDFKPEENSLFFDALDRAMEKCMKTR